MNDGVRLADLFAGLSLISDDVALGTGLRLGELAPSAGATSNASGG